MKFKEVKGLWDQLKALRETMPEGVIHEAQVYQLKQWGPLALQHVEDIEIGISLTDFLVEFRATGVTMAVPENFQDILRGLDRSVKALLGVQWSTRVLVEGEVIFEGSGKSRPKRNLARTIERLKNADAASEQGDSGKQ